MKKSVSKNLLSRLPFYLKHLNYLKEQGIEYVNSPEIARNLNLNEEQVKKDLQVVATSSGKPRLGRNVIELIRDINEFLGYSNSTDAVIVGAGHLGTAFLNYQGFNDLGLNILAAFDNDPEKVGTNINGKPVFSISKAENLIPRLGVHIAILTTPSQVGNQVSEILIKSGIKAIWNFSPTILNVPSDIIVENVNLASSLAVLSHKLKRKLEE